MSIERDFERLRAANPAPLQALDTTEEAGQLPLSKKSAGPTRIDLPRRARIWLPTPAGTAIGVAAIVIVALGVLLGSGGRDDVALPPVTIGPTSTASTVSEIALPPVFPEDLTGNYVGTLTFVEGTSDHGQVAFALEIFDDGESVTGTLYHGESGSEAGGFSFGVDIIPVEVIWDMDILHVRWDETMGLRQDTTEMQCVLVELELTLSPIVDPPRLEVDSGTWLVGGGEPRPGDQTCHNHGFEIGLTGTLRQEESLPLYPDREPARLALTPYNLAGTWQHESGATIDFDSKTNFQLAYPAGSTGSGSYSIDWEHLTFHGSGICPIPTADIYVVVIQDMTNLTMRFVEGACGDLLSGPWRRLP